MKEEMWTMLQCQRDLSKCIMVIVLKKFSMKLKGKLTPDSLYIVGNLV